MMRSCVFTLLTTVSFLLGFPQAFAAEAESAAEVDSGVQIRQRLEKVRNGNDGLQTYQATQRSRLEVMVKSGDLSSKLTIQDVRAWGSESSTLKDFSADAIDFHEAWFEFGQDIKLRLGRQEVALDGQRLIGSVNWTQQGRSFDALRLFTKGSLNFSLTASRVADGGLHDLLIAHFAPSFDGIDLGIPLIVQTNSFAPSSEIGDREQDWLRATGGLYARSRGEVPWRVEGYVQAGEDTLAYMVGARVGYEFSSLLKPALWLDLLSGDPDHSDSKVQAFDTLFATNHKFYGFADHFLAVPNHTNNGGLIDLAVKNTGKIGPGKLHTALHYFALAQENSLGQKGPLGAELDIIYTVRLMDQVKLQVGTTAFFALGDTSKEPGDNISDWTYVQLDFKI